MKSLTFDDILAAQDLKVKELEVPEWGGSVWIREFNGLTRNEFADRFKRAESDQKQLLSLQYDLIASCLCNEDGALLAPDKKLAQKLAEKNARVTDRILREIMALNALSSTAIEDAAKN